jgi:Icc-related predicted phosphoesterase
VKALIFSDIHGDLKSLERLMAAEADYYFAAGDLATWSRGLDRCGEILQPKAARVWVLPGNHESADQIAVFCTPFGFHNFHESRMQVAGYHIAGLGYSSPTPFNTPGEYSEEQLEVRLKRFAGLDPLVLICHAPPFGTYLDRVRDGVHAGSRSVRQFIETHQPRYFFCGHIHEAEGVRTRIGSTTAVNVGKQGYLLDLGG